MRSSHIARFVPMMFVLSLATLAGCGGSSAPGQATALPAGPPPTPTLDQLKSATVSGMFGQPVTLTAGKYDGPPTAPGAASHPTAMLWESAVAFGDVDGAPGNEAVAMLSSNGGGSGEFVYVAVFGMRNGALANIATAQVGDRTRLQSLWVQGGKIIMDVVEAGPKDPVCCPTQLARKTYALDSGSLKLVKNENLGTLTIGTLAANEWQLVSIDGHPIPADAKPPVIHIELNTVRGFSGCNRFTASIKETAPGAIEIGPAAATRMACPEAQMKLEQDFLTALGKVKSYSFLGGQLALTWAGKDGNGIVIFSK